MITKGIIIMMLAMLPFFAAQAQVACDCALPIDNTFQVAPMTLGHGSDVGTPPLYENNNACTPAIALPFQFCFYGQSFDSVYISNNGIVSFIKPIYSFIDSTQHIPLGADTLIIAPFFADANTLNNFGVVFYKVTSTYMAVVWDSVRYAGSDVDGWNTFQLILSDGQSSIIPDGNNISFCYPIMQWCSSDSSGGFSGYGGTPAFVGLNKGDGTHYAQLGTFDLPASDYYGPFSIYNGVDWLDFQNFTYNSCVTGGIVPPLICNNHPACNTVYVCPCDTTSTDAALGAPDSINYHCDTLTLGAQFLCTVPGQSDVLSYSVTGALNVFSVYTTSSIFDSIIVKIIPAYGDTGTHILSLIATDPVNNVSSRVSYTIDVTPACLTAGIAQLSGEWDFAVYPNPASSQLTIHYEASLGNPEVKLYEVSGREVYSGTLAADRSDVDVSALARGIYFVALCKNGISLSVKKVILL